MFDDLIVTEAKSWIGTPYHHQASLKGVGCDCLGLIRGIWRHLYGNEDAINISMDYSANWMESKNAESLLDASYNYLIHIEDGNINPGNVILFRMGRDTVAKHVSIAIGENKMIHAQEDIGVIIVNITDYWERKIAGVFKFDSNLGGK